jgi:hypothetical protein
MLRNVAGGLHVFGNTATTTTASLSDSIISGGGQGSGVDALCNIAGAVAKIFVTRSTIEGHTMGVSSTTSGVGSALVTISYSMVTNNNNGWFRIGTGVIKSLGNNHIEDNLDNVGSLTTAALQ